MAAVLALAACTDAPEQHSDDSAPPSPSTSTTTSTATLTSTTVSTSMTVSTADGSSVDGPVLRYPAPADVDYGMAAEVRGVLQLEGTCLYIWLDEAGERYPVLWPAGTRWDEQQQAVVPPVGSPMPIGGQVDGGGGYLDAADIERLAGSDAAAVATECVDNQYGLVAVVNNQPDAIALVSPPPITTTTTTAAAGLITRPYVDPALCGLGAKAVYTSTNVSWMPFSLGPQQTISIQVFGAETDGMAQPFAVVLRLPVTADDRANDHPVTINGAQVSITMVENGNQHAAWRLPDGSWAYLRGRDLDETAVVALITRLTPRSLDSAIPGFDLAESTQPDDPVLLAEHLNNDLSGTFTRFQCTSAANDGVYYIDSVQGDPVFVYLGILDRSRPYAVGVNGDGVITIDGGNKSLSLDDIVQADQATWDALPEIAPFGTQPG